MVNVRFSYSDHDAREELFFQPLYFLAENLKQYYQEKNNLKINEEMRDKKLDFSLYSPNDSGDDGSQLNFEIPPINRRNDDLIISYTLDRFNLDFSFTYADAIFHIKKVKLDDQQLITKINHDYKYILYSVYEISYELKDSEKFEEFIKESVKYYAKFYLGFKKEIDKIKVFISSCDGGYFEALGSRPKRSLDTIYVPKKQKDELMNDINDFLDAKTKHLYTELGIPYKRTYLFEGEMGSGKTSLISAIASTIGYNLAIVSFTPKMTEVQFMRMLRNFNNEQGADDNVIIVIEDIDCIFKERKSHDEARNSMSFSGILNALDGIATSQNRIIIITTQYMKNLDSALIRPGRVDYIMHFDYVVKEQIEDIFKAFTKCSDKEKINEFCNLYFEFNIKTSTSSLQQYLLKYLSKPDEAINNIDDLKKMFDMSNIGPKKSEETGLYN